MREEGRMLNLSRALFLVPYCVAAPLAKNNTINNTYTIHKFLKVPITYFYGD